jgi:hypothetical protein
MGIRQHFDRWGWLVGLAVLVVVATRFIWGREAFCGPVDEQCLREWISALGGWLAIAVAVPTFLYMQKQITDAAQHHRQALFITMRHRMEAARQAILAGRAFCEAIPEIIDALDSLKRQKAYPMAFVAALARVSVFINEKGIEPFLMDAPSELARHKELLVMFLERARKADVEYKNEMHGDVGAILFGVALQEISYTTKLAQGLAHSYIVEGQRYLTEAERMVGDHP